MFLVVRGATVLRFEFAHAPEVSAEFVVRHGGTEGIADFLAVATKHIIDGFPTIIAPSGEFRVEFRDGLRLLHEILFFDFCTDVVLAAEVKILGASAGAFF